MLIHLKLKFNNGAINIAYWQIHYFDVSSNQNHFSKSMLVLHRFNYVIKCKNGRTTVHNNEHTKYSTFSPLTLSMGLNS